MGVPAVRQPQGMLLVMGVGKSPIIPLELGQMLNGKSGSWPPTSYTPSDGDGSASRAVILGSRRVILGVLVRVEKMPVLGK